ncbi:hypothetical protein SLEP1_g24069 [Rubroshorea leprosula]|uniref:Uncharacterized protein n=1 Tax=Rubroshorea leprosula TaxID=152421 RepID=A0AAV5JHF7_9ROSI|nr:hypothetical protein SLEP1_g24069 [Rubroshorea leprosula]
MNALESLIEVSRTSVGREDLASRKIILTILMLAESSHNPSTRVQSKETIDPLCMVIYACCDGNPEFVAKLCSDPSFLILVEILHIVFIVDFQEDWFKLLLSRMMC